VKDRRQEAEGRRQKAGGRRKKAGGRRQKAEGGRKKKRLSEPSIVRIRICLQKCHKEEA